jgi:hypothetical protein
VLGEDIEDLLPDAGSTPPVVATADGLPRTVEEASVERHAPHVARYNQVHALHEKGVAIAEIARRVSVARKTVYTYLRRDQPPVRAGLTLVWSNAQVEGHVHRLKLIKRRMYGRANFDLLRQRVLHTAYWNTPHDAMCQPTTGSPKVRKFHDR